MAPTGLLLVNNLLNEIIPVCFLAPPIASTVAIAYAYVNAPNTIAISFIANDNGNATIPVGSVFDITFIQ